jgi:glycine cleavage system H lipoate-binding protein
VSSALLALVRVRRRCASAKWGGSARAAFAGRVEAVNTALSTRAATVNADPYGAGWMLLVRW